MKDNEIKQLGYIQAKLEDMGADIKILKEDMASVKSKILWVYAWAAGAASVFSLVFVWIKERYFEK